MKLFDDGLPAIFKASYLAFLQSNGGIVRGCVMFFFKFPLNIEVI